MIDIPHKMWDTTFKFFDEFLKVFCVLFPKKERHG